MSTASPAQIGAIHSIAKRLGMTEGERRDLIAGAAGGKTSCRQLTQGEAIRVIDRLKTIQGGASGAATGGAADLTGPFAAKLRALWLSGWHLGVVRDRSDKALLAFVARQTGIEHTRWLRAAGDAARAIEGVKAWLAREAGVEWPARGDVDDSKRAVYAAQLRRLASLGHPTGGLTPPADIDLDAEIRAAGAVIRRAMKGKAR